jgi:hypothetical protein
MLLQLGHIFCMPLKPQSFNLRNARGPVGFEDQREQF